MHHAPRYGIYQEKRTAQDAAATTAAALTTTTTTTTTGLFAGVAAAYLIILLLSIIKRDRDGKRKEGELVFVVVARSHANQDLW